MIASGCVADGTVSSLLTSGFDVLGTPVVGVSCLEFCPSLMVSGIFAESFRGRPLLRFGESGGFPSSLGEVGWEGGVTVVSDSGNLGGVLGGRPLFLFTGTRELALDSEVVEMASLPRPVSVLRDWFAPLPLPGRSCCSPS